MFYQLQKEPQDIYLSSFDESHLSITISCGKSQLQEIRIAQKWTNPNIKSKLPKLTCKWFNKTDTSMEFI